MVSAKPNTRSGLRLITIIDTIFFLIVKAIERTCQRPLEHELFNRDHIPFKSCLGSLRSDI